MKFEALHVEDTKIRDYLLSSRHPVGRFNPPPFTLNPPTTMPTTTPKHSTYCLSAKNH